MEKGYWGVVVLVFLSCVAQWGMTHAHICSLSNESVVKFRNEFTKNHTGMHAKHNEISLDWPVDLCQFWISSLYGSRLHPSGKKQFHGGLDLAATHGTQVKASADGVVDEVRKLDAGYGNMVTIKHKNGTFKSRYAHLHKIGVKVGDTVKLGQVIGTVGATGNVRGKNGSHLHFELEKDGMRVNPLGYLYSSEINLTKWKNTV